MLSSSPLFISLLHLPYQIGHLLSLFSKPSNHNLLSSSSFHGLKLSCAFKTQSFSSPSSSFPQISASCKLSSFRFRPIKESFVSIEMTRCCMTDMITYADTDVGGGGTGSAGLSCAYELSKKPDINVTMEGGGGHGVCCHFLGSFLFYGFESNTKKLKK